MQDRPRDFEGWPVSGEQPGVTREQLHEGAISHFISHAAALARRLRHDHEVVTSTDGESVESVHDHHTKEIVIGASLAALTVAGIITARHRTHIRKKH